MPWYVFFRRPLPLPQKPRAWQSCKHAPRFLTVGCVAEATHAFFVSYKASGRLKYRGTFFNEARAPIPHRRVCRRSDARV
ncbi:hypothetical protein [Kingella potus]|uniref:hypothetical protein n=1 Tax=Kingella potus TaxID=265175 RepID=UPI003CC80430